MANGSRSRRGSPACTRDASGQRHSGSTAPCGGCGSGEWYFECLSVAAAVLRRSNRPGVECGQGTAVVARRVTVRRRSRKERRPRPP